MKSIKLITIIYYVLFVVSATIFINSCLKLNQLLSGVSTVEAISLRYAELQKYAGITAIIFFIILLIIGLVLYFYTKKRTYIILSNILYIVIILYVFISINKEYFTVQNLDYAQQSEYWLTVFMGVFYIIGAILVSTIGYITSRNYIHRKQL